MPGAQLGIPWQFTKRDNADRGTLCDEAINRQPRTMNDGAIAPDCSAVGIVIVKQNQPAWIKTGQRRWHLAVNRRRRVVSVEKNQIESLFCLAKELQGWPSDKTDSFTYA